MGSVFKDQEEDWPIVNLEAAKQIALTIGWWLEEEAPTSKKRAPPRKRQGKGVKNTELSCCSLTGSKKERRVNFLMENEKPDPGAWPRGHKKEKTDPAVPHRIEEREGKIPPETSF